jgi:hypothetical protein
MKSAGKRRRLRRTCSLSLRVWHPIECCKIGIKQYSLAAQRNNAPGDYIDGTWRKAVLRVHDRPRRVLQTVLLMNAGRTDTLT